MIDAVTHDFILSLLYRGESETLEFKKCQYPFAEATKEQKAELLKDVLGMANAWRDSEGYIVVGVREDTPSELVGIPKEEQLDDHSLQQFVNEKTNIAVAFHYEALVVDGKHVGVFNFKGQHRPVWLKNDFGYLKKQEVYVRRGSSTNIQSPADPGEIIRMGNPPAKHAVLLAVGLIDPESRVVEHNEMSIYCRNCEFPTKIPDYPLGSDYRPFLAASLDTNYDFLREVAQYFAAFGKFVPLEFEVLNRGSVLAEDASIEIVFEKAQVKQACFESDIPPAPSKSRFNRMPHFSHGLGHVEEDSERLVATFPLGNIQPGRKTKSEKVHIDAGFCAEIEVKVSISANNIPQPLEFSFQLFPTFCTEEFTISQLIELAEAIA